MLQEAKNLQQEAVRKLVYLTNTQNEITFKAPTGSGKTYMMANMMNQILEQDKNVVFLVSSLSKGGLAEQNYNQFILYSSRGNFKSIKPYLITSAIGGEERLFVPTDYNVYLLPRDLYKKDGRLMQGPMEGFLHTMTDTLLGGLGKKIYLIKDECHQATNNLDSLSAEFFKKTYNFSATPKLSRGQHPDVEIKNEEAVAAKLIKDIEPIDYEKAGVEDAINKFEEIKTNYRNLLRVNPCLIIQISNKDKAEEELQNLYSILNKKEHSDLKWMLIVNNDKECDTNDNFKKKKLPVKKWKEYAKENLSTIDIIIFKMVITEGWDIPRACMLYQIRDSKSKQLDEQVIGRVRRNPRLTDFKSLSKEAQELAMKSWVWGVIPDELQKSFGVKLKDKEAITNEIKIKTTRLNSLINKKSFDIESFFDSQPKVIAPTSIFELYAKYKKADNTIQELCNNYSSTYTRWFKFMENIDKITIENNQFICNYEESMELVKDEHGKDIEVSFALTSHYTDSGNYVSISDWVWKRIDNNDEFSFDSEAERKWTDVLKDLVKEDNKEGKRIGKRLEPEQLSFSDVEPDFEDDHKPVYLWGKNYLPNSPIKFEYYLNTIHSSYPDFVMKDAYNRIHIFEVKSVNIAKDSGNIDGVEYNEKVVELMKAYKHASKLTDQIFYIPILRGNEWVIHQFINGESVMITKSMFFNFCKKG